MCWGSLNQRDLVLSKQDYLTVEITEPNLETGWALILSPIFQ